MENTPENDTFRQTVMAGIVGAVVATLLISAAAYASKDFLLAMIVKSISTAATQPIESTTATPGSDSDQTAPISQEQQVVAVVDKASPAVVSIVISADVPIIERYYEDDPFGGLFPFNFQVPQYRQNGTEKREIGGGSGFLVSSDGLIVTNRHVVDRDDVTYSVFRSDGTSHEAKVLARDPVNDLAVLKIEGSDLPYLEFGDSSAVRVGQSVIAIGYALAEFKNSVSVGVVSGLSRQITAGNGQGQSELLDNVIQTDAAINPGNSGGPLLNLRGKVLGVNVAVAQGSENIGFALPGNVAQAVVTSVSETGSIVRPYLGVRYVQIDARMQEMNDLPVDYGILVVRGETREELAVVPGSPADKAGIEENDIILEIDGLKLDGTRSFAALIRARNVGDTISLKILHDGEEKTVTATLTELAE